METLRQIWESYMVHAICLNIIQALLNKELTALMRANSHSSILKCMKTHKCFEIMLEMHVKFRSNFIAM